MPWRRKWHPIPGFLPGESHGAWQAAVPGVARVGHYLVTKPPPPFCYNHAIVFRISIVITCVDKLGIQSP